MRKRQTRWRRTPLLASAAALAVLAAGVGSATAAAAGAAHAPAGSTAVLATSSSASAMDATGGTSLILPGNRTTNPSFESGTSGWSPLDAKLTAVVNASAPDGSHVAEVTRKHGDGYGLATAEDTLADAVSAERVFASVEVSAATATSVGKPVLLTVREVSPRGELVRSTASTPLELTGGFQQVQVSAPSAEQGDVLSVSLVQQNAGKGDAFYADAFTVIRTPSFGVQSHISWNSVTDAQRDQALDALAAAHVGWVRIDVGWTNFEPVQRGVFDPAYVQRIDGIVNGARERGLKVLMVLYATPAWANGGKDTTYPPTDPADYADYAAWAAAHFRGRVQAYEFWNEPDPNQGFFKGTVAQYVDLVKAAYPALKKADPRAIAVTGGPSTLNDAWIEECYQAGWKGYFDALAVHPYQSPSNMPPETPADPQWAQYYMTHLPAVRDVMVHNGDAAKPIWFTEFGWSSHDNPPGTPNWALGVTEEQQADYLQRTLIMAAGQYPYVQVAIWYNDRNRTDSTVQNDNYGLLNSDFSPKPAYTAVQSFLGG